MKSMFRMVLAAFAAVFVIGALASASASASLPEFKGTFPTVFTGAGQSVRFENSLGAIWDYRAGFALSGQITGAKTLTNVTMKFSDEGWGKPSCTSWGCDCENSGAKGKELLLSGLTARLGYIKKEHETIVGLLFEPTTQPFAKCTESLRYPLEYVGRIIVPITPLGTNTTKFQLVFQQTHGKQQYRDFEGEVIPVPLKLRAFPGTGGEIVQEVGIEQGVQLVTAKAVNIAA